MAYHSFHVRCVIVYKIFFLPQHQIQAPQCSITRPKPSDFQGEKILTTSSFGGQVKPSVPCRRFAACKTSLNLRGSRNLGKITGQLSRPQFHLSRLGSLALLRRYRHLAAKVGTSKGGGKQWQTTPRTCPGCSVPEPHRSHDWALVPANQASETEY